MYATGLVFRAADLRLILFDSSISRFISSLSQISVLCGKREFMDCDMSGRICVKTNKDSAFWNSSHDDFNPAIVIWHHSNTNEVSFGDADPRFMSYSVIVITHYSKTTITHSFPHSC